MLSIDLTGKRAFVAGVADDRGYGWAIVRALAQAGATVCVGTWPPTLKIFTKSLERGKLDMSLPGGGTIELEKIYPLDAVFDTPADVPEDVRSDKRYVELTGYTIQEVADQLRADFGDACLDIIVHSLANGPCWPWISTRAWPTCRKSCTLTLVSLMKARLRPSAPWTRRRISVSSKEISFPARSARTG
jgi:enoyl-[acyl-carrier-protein] reductase (NADH)